MAGGEKWSSLKTFDPSNMYDVTAEERRAIAERSAVRETLRKEYQKKLTNPYRGVGGYIFDPAVQRFLSMRSNHYEQFKATPKSAAFGFFGALLPIALLWYLVDWDRSTREGRIRRGEVSYADRDWKFIR